MLTPIDPCRSLSGCSLQRHRRRRWTTLLLQPLSNSNHRTIHPLAKSSQRLSSKRTVFRPLYKLFQVYSGHTAECAIRRVPLGNIRVAGRNLPPRNIYIKKYGLVLLVGLACVFKGILLKAKGKYAPTLKTGKTSCCKVLFRVIPCSKQKLIERVSLF